MSNAADREEVFPSGRLVFSPTLRLPIGQSLSIGQLWCAYHRHWRGGPGAPPFDQAGGPVQVFQLKAPDCFASDIPTAYGWGSAGLRGAFGSSLLSTQGSRESR